MSEQRTPPRPNPDPASQPDVPAPEQPAQRDDPSEEGEELRERGPRVKE